MPAQKSTACKDYTSYLKKMVESNEPIIFTLVGLAPCELIYQKVGEHLKRQQQIESLLPINDRYQTWITSYSNEERRHRVEKFLAAVNQLCLQLMTNKKDVKLLEIFKNAAEYEHLFWMDVYNAV